jgi:hypothetical protein
VGNDSISLVAAVAALLVMGRSMPNGIYLIRRAEFIVASVF